MRWPAAFILLLGFALAAPAPALAAPPPYYPPIEYVPAARANYDVGRTMAITQIVIHETDGTWFSAVNWFQNPRSRVSAHYLVKAWGGGIRSSSPSPTPASRPAGATRTASGSSPNLTRGTASGP